jgi:glycosyltransferase A (GT-A) superfamily protein (DUF2064 family)
MIKAAWWYRQQTRSLIRRLRDKRWDILLAVSPDVEGMESRVWPADLERIPQGAGDLGARMTRAFAATQGPTLLIGSDIPGINRRHIARAFDHLVPGGSVIGPAPDGGYWLVGLWHPSRGTPGLFRQVRWSTEHTLADTLAGLPRPVAQVDSLRDVDRVTDLPSSSV